MDGTQHTDEQLVALARSGDKDAFGCLVERHQPLAMRMALRMVPHADIAGELVQEGVLQAYLSLNCLREAMRFGSWLCGIVLNLCRGYIRSQRVVTLSWEELDGGVWLAQSPLIEATPDPQQVAEDRELHRTVLCAVRALPQGERAATLLFYYGQMSLQEIAMLLGISTAAVKVRLHRARTRLKENLLSAHAEIEPVVRTNHRRTEMIRMVVEDVRSAVDNAGKHWAVIVLVDEARQRFVPIWVGEHEGRVLALELRKTPLDRPLTITLMANLLKAAGSDVEEVRIEALKDTTFHAVVKLRTATGEQEIDARPSDAVPLAVHLGKPVYASDQVLNAAGLPADDLAERAKAQAQKHGLVVTWEESLLSEGASTPFELKP
jgi:RNA polymerase sigma factor (sigma-70 family)